MLSRWRNVPKFFQPVHGLIGARAVAKLSGDVDVERKSSAAQVIVVDAGREALYLIHPRNQSTCLRGGLHCPGRQERQHRKFKKRSLVAKSPSQVDPFLVTFGAVLAVAEVKICTRKAAEELAPRPLIVGLDHTHRFSQ